ncbi:MAG: smalltalk protein [Prevotella sp.]|nr:smalltalk protein [Prevotella sp.]
MPEASEIPEVPEQGSSKKKLWKFIIQTLINILAAILTALGATSCL